jgi:hypothetical protein
MVDFADDPLLPLVRMGWTLSVLGGFGITGAGLAAKAKSAAQAVRDRLRAVVEQDVVNVAVTLPPRRHSPKPRAAPDASSASPTIKHVVVLALENRSFDHLLGYLDHPDPTFDGLRRGGSFVNPRWPGLPAIAANDGAKTVLPVDPDHSHDAIMEQLALAGPRKGPPTHQPRLRDQLRTQGAWAGAAEVRRAPGDVGTWWQGRNPPPPPVLGRSPLAMACHPPTHVPVLSQLAQRRTRAG